MALAGHAPALVADEECELKTAMKNQTASSVHFYRKISSFCDVRIAPLVSTRDLENIKLYLSRLIARHTPPPMRMSRVDWEAICDACGLKEEMTPELKKNLQPGLEAIIRWIAQKKKVKGDDHVALARSNARSVNAPRTSRPRTAKTSTSTKPAPNPRSSEKIVAISERTEEFPRPLFDWTDDPPDFQQALAYHMRRHGEDYLSLYRTVGRDHATFNRTTLLSWTNGAKVPRSVDSFEILSRIERRYRLPDGYSKGSYRISPDRHPGTTSGAISALPSGEGSPGICRTISAAFPSASARKSSSGFAGSSSPVRRTIDASRRRRSNSDMPSASLQYPMAVGSRHGPTPTIWNGTRGAVMNLSMIRICWRALSRPLPGLPWKWRASCASRWRH